MSSKTWRYWAPFRQNSVREHLLPQGEEGIAALIETVGERELELMLRARSSSTGTLVLTHGREGNAERLAARRLMERQPPLLAGGNWLGPDHRGGRLYAYVLTARGLSCWLRAQKREGR